MQHCAMAKEHGGAMMSADLPERLNMMEQHMTLHLDSIAPPESRKLILSSALSHWPRIGDFRANLVR
jgi:hypothetical protein